MQEKFWDYGFFNAANVVHRRGVCIVCPMLCVQCVHCWEVEQGPQDLWECIESFFEGKPKADRPNVCLKNLEQAFSHEALVLPPNTWSFYSVQQTFKACTVRWKLF